jgi:hypothetical protein
LITVDRCFSPYFAFKLCKFQQNLWLITPYPWTRLFESMVLPLCYIIMCNEVSKHFLEKPHKYLWGALDGVTMLHFWLVLALDTLILTFLYYLVNQNWSPYFHYHDLGCLLLGIKGVSLLHKSPSNICLYHS